MDKLLIKYRTWFKGIPPQPIKLQIPGWAGQPNNHTNGDKPQSWHCPPFVDGSTYGLEIYYPFDNECRVYMKGEEVIFDGDFSQEQIECPETSFPPFKSFSPGHFGMISSLDIQAPEGCVLRTEPHPRFYTDTTYTVPCCLPGHIQTEWWPKIFFVVFKNPMPGQTIIFRKNEPYAQVLVIPKKVTYDIRVMTPQEINERNITDDKITLSCKQFVKNDWYDHKGQNFDDKYKILSSIFAKGGTQAVKNFLNTTKSKDSVIKKIFRTKLIVRKKK